MTQPKVILAVALAAGSLCTTAFAQRSSPTKATPAPAKKKVLQVAPRANRAVPTEIAGIRRVAGGRYQLTTPWMAYQGGVTDAPETPIFDCYESDATGLPINFCTSCNSLNAPQCGGPEDDGARWWFGPTYTNPFVTNDMASIAPGFSNGQASRVTLEWAWRASEVGTVNDCYVAVFTSETFVPCAGGGPPATAGDFDGVILHFVALGPGIWYSDNDLTQDLLFLQMPADGSGAYQIVLANAFDPVGGTLTVDTTGGTQPMIWSTGEHETPPDGRVGTETPEEWDDDFPADGAYTVAECYDNSRVGTCPEVFSAMIKLWGEGGATPPACYANCDSSTTNPFLNVLDFNCFLNRFTQGASYANCDNSTTPPILNVLDFNCFLNRFTQGCSAP